MAMSDCTRILPQIEQGNLQAAEMLVPRVYDEPRKLPAANMPHEKPGQTLQATALVPDAYVKLVEIKRQQSRDDRKGIAACCV